MKIWQRKFGSKIRGFQALFFSRKDEGRSKDAASAADGKIRRGRRGRAMQVGFEVKIPATDNTKAQELRAAEVDVILLENRASIFPFLTRSA